MDSHGLLYDRLRELSTHVRSHRPKEQLYLTMERLLRGMIHSWEIRSWQYQERASEGRYSLLGQLCAHNMDIRTLRELCFL